MMATCQLLHTRQKKSSKESVLFPNKIDTKKQSVVLVKRLLAISVSCITYLRGLFPESSYGTRYLDDLCLKILREDKSCLGSFQIVKWIQGCFDALERQYLHIAVLAIYTNPKEPETVTELYQFKFKYKKEAPQMDIISNKMNFVNGVCSEDIKQASSLLIRKLYLLMQNLGPLPNDITLTMKLFYYNEVTPKDYQPPGFKEEVSPADLLFDGDPVNLKVGSVSTGFHTMKVKVTTENKRMGRVESNLIQKNGPTEISHQGLDYDEEEEEGSTKDNPLPVRADSGEPEKNKNDTHPGWRTEASSFCLQDTGGKEKTEIEEKGRMPSSRASQQMKIRINSTDVSALLYWKLIGDYCQALPRPFNLCAAFTEWQRSEGTTGEPLDQPACSKQAARDLVQSHPSISKDGDSTTSLDKLCQLITLIVKKSFSISCLNLVFSQEEVIGPKKKRKVSEPEKLLLEGRK